MSWYILVALCFFIGSSYTGHLNTFDTVFLVDSSSSAREKDRYDLIRKFVANLTIELVHTRKHRVGIISFNGVVYRVILKLTNDAAEVRKGVKNLNKTSGFSYVSQKLNTVVSKMFHNSIHIGDGKQIITVLGGNPNSYDAITKTATSLKANGLEMYSVGVGPDFFNCTKELKTLASLPIKDHTLRTTYKSLLKSTPIILKKIKKDAVAFIYRRKRPRKVRVNKSKYQKPYTLIANAPDIQIASAPNIQSATIGTQSPDDEIDISSDTEGSGGSGDQRARHSVAKNLLQNYFGSGVSTVRTPSTSHPDMESLLASNSTDSVGTAPSCVGLIPIANRILTNGTMITGIVPAYLNTTVPATRACDPNLATEEGISNGDSGIDATWDYGK